MIMYCQILTVLVDVLIITATNPKKGLTDRLLRLTAAAGPDLTVLLKIIADL